MEECGLNSLQQLPKFQPPNFSHLPVPDSPEPTPLPAAAVLASPLPAIGERSLSSWLDSDGSGVLPDRSFSCWPHSGESGAEADDERHGTISSTISAPWLSDIPKESGHLSLSPTSSYPASDHRDCPTPLGDSKSESIWSMPATCDSIVDKSHMDSMRSVPEQNGETQLNSHSVSIWSMPEKIVSVHDELCTTKLVFPQVSLGAVLAPVATSPLCTELADLAPLPGDVPTPVGLSCVTNFGFMPESIEASPYQEAPEDSPAFAWYLPVPESPDPTPILSSTAVFSWASAAHCQAEPAAEVEPLESVSSVEACESTGGTGECSVVERVRPCSLGSIKDVKFTKADLDDMVCRLEAEIELKLAGGMSCAAY